MKRVQFAAAYPERLVHPLHRRVIEPGPVTRAELLTWSPTADATTLFWCDADADATASVVRVVDSLVEKELVEDGDGRTRSSDRTATSSRRRCLTRSRPHVVFLPPVVFLDTGDVRFEAVGEAAALGAFHEALTDLGDVAIEQVHEFERTASPSRLTDRQRDALEAAVAAGITRYPATGPSKTSPRPSTARRARPANWCGRPRQR